MILEEIVDVRSEDKNAETVYVLVYSKKENIDIRSKYKEEIAAFEKQLNLWEKEHNIK